MNNDIEFFSRNEIDRNEYKAWAQDPKTQHYIRIVEQLNRPLAISTADPNYNALLHSQQVGINMALTQLQTLDLILVQDQAVDADYGMEKYLEQWGRNKSK